MRAIAVIGILGCALLARADTPPFAPRTAPVGFSHAIHATDVAKAQQPELACTRCHSVRNGVLAGRPNHASCFGTCHGAPPGKEPMPPERRALCNPCHAESALVAAKRDAKALAVPYPPYVLAVDHATQLGHKSHAAIACDRCHARVGSPPGTPHKRCIGCHDGGKAPAMATCVTCHVDGNDTPKLQRMKPDGTAYEIFVTTAFSHARHATRGAARQCVTCHRDVTTTDNRGLPRPTADGCAIAGCHDAKAAFGITASCTKCHKDVPVAKFKTARPPSRFSHLLHDTAKLACAACHPLGKTGEVLVSNHTPCAPCHADDFGKRIPKTCGACHNGTEPWRLLVADRLPAEITEFGVEIDHRKHATTPCASCHSLATTGTELRPPRGHRSCSAAGCHAVATGPAPKLTECEACHHRGLIDQRDRLRRAATWSVRATFVHAPHREAACTVCHTDMTSPNVLALAVPGKATCARAGCHDGQGAFKVTGTACTRCHPGEPK
ncbi:MAG: hypothetical protein ABI867_30950 [Kofleriaceae bacterium]